MDYRRLGLNQQRAMLHFSRPYYNSAVKILDAFNKFGYLTYFTKVLPQGAFLVTFSLPSGTTEQFQMLLARLVDRKILTGFSLDEVVASRHPLMNPRFFNFGSGIWEVDWDKVRRHGGSHRKISRDGTRFLPDRYDLFIVKELQKDATQHVVKIARKLKVDGKTLQYHFRSHVIREKLIPSFFVRWTRDVGKGSAQSAATISLTFSGLDQKDLVAVQRAVSKIPYLWAEDLLADGTYIATIDIPSVNGLLSTLAYINAEVGELTRVELTILESSETGIYTIPHHLFRTGRWTFDVNTIETAVTKSLTPMRKE